MDTMMAMSWAANMVQSVQAGRLEDATAHIEAQREHQTRQGHEGHRDGDGRRALGLGELIWVVLLRRSHLSVFFVSSLRQV